MASTDICPRGPKGRDGKRRWPAQGKSGSFSILRGSEGGWARGARGPSAFSGWKRVYLNTDGNAFHSKKLISFYSEMKLLATYLCSR